MGLFSLFKKNNNNVKVTINKPSDDELKKQMAKEYMDQPPVKKQAVSSNKMSNNQRFRELSISSQKHLQEGNIGFYRNNLYSMAYILEKEGNLRDALKQYLYVFYLDVSGVSSFDALKMGLKPHPIITPAVPTRIRIVLRKLKITSDELKELYFQCDKESYIPHAAFTYKKSYELLEMYLSGNQCEADKIVEEASKRHKR